MRKYGVRFIREYWSRGGDQNFLVERVSGHEAHGKYFFLLIPLVQIPVNKRPKLLFGTFS